MNKRLLLIVFLFVSFTSSLFACWCIPKTSCVGVELTVSTTVEDTLPYIDIADNQNLFPQEKNIYYKFYLSKKSNEEIGFSYKKRRKILKQIIFEKQKEATLRKMINQIPVLKIQKISVKTDLILQELKLILQQLKIKKDIQKDIQNTTLNKKESR